MVKKTPAPNISSSGISRCHLPFGHSSPLLSDVATFLGRLFLVKMQATKPPLAFFLSTFTSKGKKGLKSSRPCKTVTIQWPFCYRTNIAMSSKTLFFHFEGYDVKLVTFHCQCLLFNFESKWSLNLLFMLDNKPLNLEFR